VFKSLSIPGKLRISFLLICVSAAIMMGVFFINMAKISSSTERSNFSRSIYADAQVLETALLRQNSQLRGFLVTADTEYLKTYYEARDDYDETSTKLEGEVSDPEELELLRASRKETLAWRRQWGDRLIAMVRAGGRDKATEEVRVAGKAVMITAAVLPLRAMRDAEKKLIDANGERQGSAISTAMVTLIIGGIVLIGIAVTLATVLSRSIARPITGLTQTMRELAAGHNDVTVPGADRVDELGDMARTVGVFRDSALAKARADADQAHVVEALGTALEAMSAGDMTYLIEQPFEGMYDKLRQSFNASVEGLEESLSRVAGCAKNIQEGSAEIRAGTEDLSHRTERQAGSIEETAAATRDVTETVADSARSTSKLRDSISEVQADAAEGGSVVDLAVGAMDAIDKSAKEVAQIITVIEGIAFQTNLLALNAGVEAARAGESGRGFAVVATEVRALAQRSAEAANDIKALITTSSQQVTQGVDLVAQTGKMLRRIGSKIDEVTGLIKEIASGTEVQSRSLGSVNGAIEEMNTMTQQNASMAEESTACARNLAEQANQLEGLVTRFQLKADDALHQGSSEMFTRKRA
jgi:methyl-accepting chemotaxis protein